MTDEPSEDFPTAILVYSSLSLTFLAVTGLLIFDLRFAIGVVCGGSIALINYIWMRSIMKRILTLTISRPVMFAITRFILRYGLTAVALFFALRSPHISLAGLLTGLSVIVITLTTLSFARIARSGG